MDCSKDRRVLWVDVETFSSVNLKRAGLYKYMESPDFEILLIQYAWNDEPVRVLDLMDPEALTDPNVLQELPDIVAGLQDPDTLKIAHNNAFERAAFHRQFGTYMPPEEWDDAMILCAMNGLPMSLDAAGEALQIEMQKLKEGKALINYFCKPCKPTKANGGRTRNLPHHDPERWERFKAYGGRDVEAMREIYKRLEGFTVPAWERKVGALDTRINERGVMIDRELAEAAVAVDEAFTAEHAAELQRLTGLENPNSVAQLKGWLVDRGVECDSLNKATVAEMRHQTDCAVTDRVLELRQMLGKTSTKKYPAMIAAACADDRVRGLLQYYGAGRTGRWAGRLVQLQNLVQNHLNDIDAVREIVRERDLEALEWIYPSVPDVLSQLIRTALIAKEGHTFLVADFSAIEARVIAYLAGERWRMDVFAQGGDIYCQSAAQMFGVPVEKHGINSHLRQKGKVAELACIAEGQQVLTDHGLISIEQVTTAMRVWDGVEWVSHEGVICRGLKEVITYGGLTATPDHPVWIEGQAGPVHFGHAAASGARLTKAGAGGRPLWVGGDYQPGEALEQNVEPLLCANPLQRLRSGAMATFGQLAVRQVKRLSELFPKENGATLAEQALRRRQTKMYKPGRQKLQKLRRTGHRVQIPKREGGLPLYDRNQRAAVARFGDRPDQRQRPLRARQPAMGDPSRKLSKPTPNARRVYDIVNAGPRHRFTVSDVLVHNCGYGGGVGALKAFGADKMGLAEEEMQSLVSAWRQASPTIPRFWRDAENAARRALERPGLRVPIPCGVSYIRDRDALRCQLPSGRVLSYWGARLEDGIVFQGQNQTTRKWEKVETWGGKLVENIVQAYARDCLAVALLRLDAAGYPVVFHVHDEIIAEMPKGSQWEDMADIMAQPIPWARGLVLRADGYETPFYKKD